MMNPNRFLIPVFVAVAVIPSLGLNSRADTLHGSALTPTASAVWDGPFLMGFHNEGVVSSAPGQLSRGDYADALLASGEIEEVAVGELHGLTAKLKRRSSNNDEPSKEIVAVFPKGFFTADMKKIVPQEVPNPKDSVDCAAAGDLPGIDQASQTSFCFSWSVPGTPNLYLQDYYRGVSPGDDYPMTKFYFGRVIRKKGSAWTATPWVPLGSGSETIRPVVVLKNGKYPFRILWKSHVPSDQRYPENLTMTITRLDEDGTFQKGRTFSVAGSSY